MGLQDAGTDGAYPVKEHLQDEDPERKTPRAPGPLSTSAGERLGRDCKLVTSPTSGSANTMPTSERTSISGSTSVKSAFVRRRASSSPCVVMRSTSTGIKIEYEYAAHEQLVDQARQQDGGRVGVGHQPRRENGGLRHPPPVPRSPRQNGRRRDRKHGPEDRSAKARLPALRLRAFQHARACAPCQHAPAYGLACQHASALRASLSASRLARSCQARHEIPLTHRSSVRRAGRSGIC